MLYAPLHHVSLEVFIMGSTVDSYSHVFKCDIILTQTRKLTVCQNVLFVFIFLHSDVVFNVKNYSHNV